MVEVVLCMRLSGGIWRLRLVGRARVVSHREHPSVGRHHWEVRRRGLDGQRCMYQRGRIRRRQEYWRLHRSWCCAWEEEVSSVSTLKVEIRRSD